MPLFLIVVGQPIINRKSIRHQESKAEILEAAWQLVRAHGVAGLTMGDLGRAVGMRPQSLYSYFGSKHEIYDALFAQGFENLIADRRALALDAEPEAALRQGCRAFIDFCVADPARCQLLFQRSVPGFEPSPASLALTVEALSYLEAWLGAAGVEDPAAVDLLRALLIGLAGEQIANEPGGERWTRLLDPVLDAFLFVVRPPRGVGRALPGRRRG